MTADEFKHEPLLLKRKEVLRITGWGKNTLYRKVEAGVLVPVPKVGSRIMQFRKVDLAAVIGLPC